LLWEEADQALKQTAKAKIPVLVKLRRCTGTIESLMQDFCRSHQLPLTLAEIETLRDQGKLLLLLDGLNELPEAFRTDVANFRDRYRATTPMIVSTRELSIGGNLGIAKRYWCRVGPIPCISRLDERKRIIFIPFLLSLG
jgi:hypothetical protein